MVTRKSRKAKTRVSTKAPKLKATQLCEMPVIPEREFTSEVGPLRAGLIRQHNKKWANGTVLHFYFFTSPRRWSGTTAEKNIVRGAFERWKNLGIGLSFKEVSDIDEAEVRIGFLRGDGAWSYIGRDVLGIASDQRTMNFGWNIGNDIDTAIHEIGHTLGFPHEHQNPNSGIVWDEEKVYADLAAPPNRWPRDKTYHNIIRKIDPQEVGGSNWDPDSIMHYPFDAGLILQPEIYQTQPLDPAPGLSALDKTTVKSFYPAMLQENQKLLESFRSYRLELSPGEQENFVIQPDATRSYTIASFGMSDTVMVLFEKIGEEWRYFTADDDSGYQRNARLNVRLYAGRKYALRIRLFYQQRRGNFAVMMW